MVRTSPRFDGVPRWMQAYRSGQDTRALPIELDLHGTPFQLDVPRATGTAVGRNPVILIVACHRVIGANGLLSGFAAGLHRKEWLCQHEGVLLA